MLELQGAGYAYGSDGGFRVHDVSFSVAPGERIVIVGRNGSGKSTVARLANGRFIVQTGRVLVDGVDPAAGPEDRLEVSQMVGFVAQDPASQLVASTVFDEVAFGPCNLGLPVDEVFDRVEEALERVDLDTRGIQEVSTLSGGELQRLSIAGVLALSPDYLVLDEVCAYLDSASHARIRTLVEDLLDGGMGVLEVSHGIDDCLTADGVVLMEDGAAVWKGSVREFFSDDGLLKRSGLLPSRKARIANLLVPAGFDIERIDDASAIVDFARANGLMDMLRRIILGVDENDPSLPDAESAISRIRDGRGSRPGILELLDARVRIKDRNILYGCTFSAEPGKVTLVAGRSGSGKTTCCRVLTGALEVDAGAARFGNRSIDVGDVGFVMQRPESQLFCETVAQDIGFACRAQGMDAQQTKETVELLMEALELPEDVADDSPFELSGGRQRRVAIAGVLAMGADAYVFDEPTAGLDGAARSRVYCVVRALAKSGCSVVVVSHALGEWIAQADEAVLIDGGHVSWTGSVDDLRYELQALVDAGLSVPVELELAPVVLEESRIRWMGPVLPDDTGVRVRAHHAAKRRTAKEPTIVHALDARAKIVGLLVLTILLFAVDSVFMLGIVGAFLIALLWLSGTDPRDVLRFLKPAAIILGFSLLANTLRFDGSGDSALIGSFGLSPAGAANGAKAVLRVVELLGFALVVSTTTSSAALANACAWFIGPLAAIGVPIDDVAQVLASALRFIPLAAEEFDRIVVAQRIRGMDFDNGKLFERISAWRSVFVPLVVVLFRRADDVADAMRDRAWGSAPRTRV
ncbi:MAG: ATP-binding cassette domain-containing protein [Atopobiaceae bacterium]|nr:ATP-binding cassette domain-containing protein [Atopobiaceae bacterium]